MVGFEVVVRPVVFPAIRPTSARPAAPQDDPGNDVALIAGLGGKLIDLSFSQSGSVSRSRPTEVSRVVDVQRVKQKEPDGTVNEDNYVDVETTKRMTMQGGDGGRTTYYYAPPPEADNIETIEKDVTIKNPNWSEGGGGAAP